MRGVRTFRTPLFLSLAEIAGVFLGFGALIAVRSGNVGEPQEVAPMRLVVGMAMLTYRRPRSGDHRPV